jgi:hypothetical protein
VRCIGGREARTPPTLRVTLLLAALLAAFTTYLEALLIYYGAVADAVVE